MADDDLSLDPDASDNDSPGDPTSSSPDLEATLRLAFTSGVGPRIYHDLIDRFGSPAAVLAATAGELRTVSGVGPKLIASLRDAHRIDVARELELCRSRNVTILSQDQSAYPRMLREIHDPPPVLFMLGELAAGDALAIAIVGTRHPTQYGLRQAERLAGGLARAGLTVVSGLARGIDAAAHRGALAAGGRTLAVLGGGVLNIYPPEHAQLAAEVQKSGALLGESPPLREPFAGSFPQRNRIVTGLSLGVIVVEAADRSGALISARLAMEQNREVFAVPGPVDSRVSRGCHRLLRNGARLVESVDDVLEELGPLVESTTSAAGREVKHPAELQLNEQERLVLDAVANEPTLIDDVVVASKLPVQRVLATLSALEMRRLIRRISGSLVVRV